MSEPEDAAEGVSLHFDRLNQMPLRLTKIVHDQLLPALGAGGQAIVLTRFDPTPNDDGDVPIEVTFVSGVADQQQLLGAGEMIRQWTNSLISHLAGHESIRENIRADRQRRS